jgi:uncharacterized membrane protein YccC
MQTAKLTLLSENAAFTLRVLAAFAIAYYAAYWLELDSPASAGTTVLIVADASRGAIISKSLWRVVGSVVGAIAAIGLVALFAQAPVLFVFALALWIGLCTAVASLLRYNRGYAAVLSGYTVALVAFGAIGDPERIFDLAAARLAVVIIGVLSAMVVSMITDPGPGSRAVENRVIGLIEATARLISDALAAPDLAAARAARSRVAAEIGASDQLLEFVVVEDAVIGRYAPDLRLALAELFAALTGGLRAVELLRREQPEHARALRLVLANMASDLRTIPAAELLGELAACRADLAMAADQCRDVPALAALDQAADLLAQFAAALVSLDAVQRRRPRRTTVRLRFYVNPVTALRNGLRATIAMSIGGLFWIISQWTSGPAMLTLLGPICALLALTDSAAAGSIAFFKGVLLAIAAGFLCTYGILPRISGFPLLMFVFLPFLVPAILATRAPRTAGIARAFLIFFNTAVGATNPMRFNLAASLNTYLAFAIGGFCAVLAFRVLLPPNPIAEARVLAHSIRNEVQRVARARRVPPRLVYEHLQHQKLLRISRRLAANPAQRVVATSNGAVAVLVGRVLGQLKRASSDTSLPAAARAAAARTVASCRRLLAAPAQAARVAGEESDALAAEAAPQPVLHLAASLHELSQLVGAHTDFFARAQALPERT